MANPTSSQRLPSINTVSSPNGFMSQSSDTKTKLISLQKLEQPDTLQSKSRKDQEFEDELEKLDAEIDFSEVGDDFCKGQISISMGEPMIKLSERSKTMFSLDVIHDSLLKQFKESYCNINDLAKNIDRLFDILSAPRLYSENLLCKTLKVIESFLDTQFDYIVITQKNIQSLLGLARYIISTRLAMRMVDCLFKMLAARTNMSQFTNNIVEIAEVMGRLVFLAVSQKEYKAMAPKLALRYLQVINQLAGSDSNPCYVPGRSNEADLVRKLLVVVGVPVVIISLVKNKYSLPEPLLEAADKLLLNCFCPDEFQFQIDILNYCEKQACSLFDLSTEDINKMSSCKVAGMLAKMMLQKAVKFYRREIDSFFLPEKDRAIVFENKEEEKTISQKVHAGTKEEAQTMVTTAESSQQSEGAKRPSVIAQAFLNSLNLEETLQYLRKFEGNLQRDKKRSPAHKHTISRIT